MYYLWLDVPQQQHFWWFHFINMRNRTVMIVHPQDRSLNLSYWLKKIFYSNLLLWFDRINWYCPLSKSHSWECAHHVLLRNQCGPRAALRSWFGTTLSITSDDALSRVQLADLYFDTTESAQYLFPTRLYIRGWIQMVLTPNDLFSWNNKYNKYAEYNINHIFTRLF